MRTARGSSIRGPLDLRTDTTCKPSDWISFRTSCTPLSSATSPEITVSAGTSRTSIPGKASRARWDRRPMIRNS